MDVKGISEEFLGYIAREFSTSSKNIAYQLNDKTQECESRESGSRHPKRLRDSEEDKVIIFSILPYNRKHTWEHD